MKNKSTFHSCGQQLPVVLLGIFHMCTVEVTTHAALTPCVGKHGRRRRGWERSFYHLHYRIQVSKLKHEKSFLQFYKLMYVRVRSIFCGYLFIHKRKFFRHNFKENKYLQLLLFFVCNSVEFQLFLLLCRKSTKNYRVSGHPHPT